jgi:hypothetical protein
MPQTQSFAAGAAASSKLVRAAGAASFSLVLSCADRLQRALREIFINHKRVFAATWLSAAKFRGVAKPSVSGKGFFCCSRAFVGGFAIPPQLLTIKPKLAAASSSSLPPSRKAGGFAAF